VTQYEGDYLGDGKLGVYYHSGMKFTTYDQDNDLSYWNNCAAGRGGAWWYNVCYWACLMCKIDKNEWDDSLPDHYIVNSRMTIKPQ